MTQAIKSAKDLEQALRELGPNPDTVVRQHLVRRARALSRCDLLPPTWTAPCAADNPQYLLEQKLAKHNSSLDTQFTTSLIKVKVVYRRGLEVYDQLGIRGVTREHYAQSRVSSFLHLLKTGVPRCRTYIADNDLLPRTHPRSQLTNDEFEKLHPRGWHGHWIEKGDKITADLDGAGRIEGTVTGWDSDNAVHVKVTASTDSPKSVGQTVTVAARDIKEAPHAVARLGGTPLHMQNVAAPSSAPAGMRAATPSDRSRLKIPPAWTDVHVSIDSSAALQARGRDSKGRAQYRYSNTHNQQQADKKFARMKALHEKLPQLDAALQRDMSTSDTAAAVYLIRKMGVRNGSETDTGAAKFAYGASNLRVKHVLVDGSNVTLDFDAKDNVHLALPVHDEQLKALLRVHVAGKTSDSRVFNTNESKTNAYLKQQTGDDFKIKDLRTYLANQSALSIMASMPKPTTLAQFKKQRLEVAKRVSAELGNTPTIALSSYINPAVFATWTQDASWSI